MPKARNIIIFVSIAVVLILVYWFFFRSKDEPSLVVGGTAPTTLKTTSTAESPNSNIIANSLPVLLSIQDIKLEISIFSDPSFQHLKDSSIILTPEGNEGRSNPFAPIGYDTLSDLQNLTPVPTPASTTTGTTPPKNN